MQTRYYNPDWCRWISPDNVSYLDPETPHGINLYLYCGNDPINYVDPSGHFAVTTILLIVGAIIGASVGGAIAYDIAEESGAEGWELAGWTILGVIGGGALGGALGYGIVTIPAGAASLAGIMMFSKGSGPRFGEHNQHENQMFKEAMRQLGVNSKSDPRWSRYQRTLERHKKTTGRYFETLKELLEYLDSLF